MITLLAVEQLTANFGLYETPAPNKTEKASTIGAENTLPNKTEKGSTFEAEKTLLDTIEALVLTVLKEDDLKKDCITWFSTADPPKPTERQAREQDKLNDIMNRVCERRFQKDIDLPQLLGHPPS